MDKTEDLKKEETVKTEAASQDKPQEEYDNGWKEADAILAQEGVTTTDGSGEKIEEKIEEKIDEKKPPVEEERKAEDKKDEKSQHHGSVESLEKALNDTKKHANTLADQLAELKKKVEQYEAGEATKKEVDEQKKATEKAQDDLDAVKDKIYEDYPELKAVLDPMLERQRNLENELKTIKTEKSTRDESDAHAKALEAFEKNVKPKVVEVHKDFDDIMHSKEYWEWAEKQRPALKFAAMNSPDPDDIIYAIGEYKKEAAEPEFQKVREKEKSMKEEKVSNAQTLRGGSSSDFPVRQKSDAKDYEAGWNEADKLLEAEGIRV